MKNIRLLIGTLCCAALWLGLFAGRAGAQTVVTVPGNVALEIESRTITKAEADQFVKSGDKVTLDIYLVLKEKNKWTDFLLKNDVFIGNNRISVAFYEDEKNMPNGNYDRSIYLQNPEDYISICANSLMSSVMPAGGCTAATRGGEFGLKWYMEPVTWFETRKSNEDATYMWPTYSYGGGNRGGLIEADANYIVPNDNDIKIRLFSIQFILKNGTRNFPVGFVDGYTGTLSFDGSPGNIELNIGDNPIYLWSGAILGQDWTQAPSPYFEFVPGGLFIERAPEVEKLECNIMS